MKNTKINKVAPPSLTHTTKQEIKDYFKETYELYEVLFRSIKPEAYYKIPDPLRRPIIFYLGHSAALYINKLNLANFDCSINAWFEKLFKTGVDPIYREELDNDVYHPNWPTVDEVWEYRRKVFEKVNSIIDSVELTLPIKADSVWWAILMTPEHERIHFETSVLLMRQLDVSDLVIPSEWVYAPINNSYLVKNDFIEVKGREVLLGKERDFPTYGWDNEYGTLRVNVRDFEATKFLITNAEYLEFVKDGGYKDDSLWSDEGLEWKKIYKAEHPLFWVKTVNEHNQVIYKYRALYDILEMPLNWPVEVIHHEAKAYCNWINRKSESHTHRLIKEAEFNLIRGEDEFKKREIKTKTTALDKGAYHNYNSERKIGNINLHYGSSSSVDEFDPSPLGFYDCYGNVWEHSEDYFRAFPGFEANFYYWDFSAPCFDYYHSLILGSAWNSTGLSASSYVRIAFRRHFYQNCGFRLVREPKSKKIADPNQYYELKRSVSDYLSSFYYDSKEHFFSFNSNERAKVSEDMDHYLNGHDFAQETTNFAINIYKSKNSHLKEFKGLSAFDLGCGVGKSAFLLSSFFDKVIGLDYSHAFIEACEKLQKDGFLEYENLRNGDYYTKAIARVPGSIDRSKIHFMQGDAMNIPHLLGPFDLIFASNLIDRLSNPEECLVNLRPMLKKGGLLVLISPYTWMEHFTEKSKWIGGKDGEGTFESLKKLMKTLCFDFVEDKTMKLILREHERKYQLIFPHLTVWERTQFNEEFATSIFK